MAEQDSRHAAAPSRIDATHDGDISMLMGSDGADAPRRSRPAAVSRPVRSGRTPGGELFASTLDAAPTGHGAVVLALAVPPEAPEWAQWLEEIGFIPGERVMVMARGLPGGDPLVVRVGNSTFALRRAEAACIEIGSAPP